MGDVKMMPDRGKPSACILCESNCGVRIQLGEDGRTFERIRGDKDHPTSHGYTCNKALRLDHYQNGRNDRVTQPLRRRADGSFEEIGWHTAVAEVTARLSAIKEVHGGEAIFYYGGGGQGNHLGGAFASATMQAFGLSYRSNALAQEKTGEFWVDARMLGGYVRADIENAEVVLFVGKNPYQSHGFPRARTVLKEIAKDPARTMIVIDPVRTETAELADVHFAVRPGTDSYLLAALTAVLIEEDLIAHAWLTEHATGLEDVRPALGAVPIARYAEVCGIAEEAIRDIARRLATASSVSVIEDLGVQMNRDSTLVSYLEKLMWLLTGNFGKSGTQYLSSSIMEIGRDRGRAYDRIARSPVVGAPIISGLVPCNVIADEILTDHPARYRAMIVESANPVHSLADSAKMREALQSLETLVVMDVALTETAQLADYVLPAPTQFEKWEATFYNFDFPRNLFHLRAPVLPAPEGPLPEPEIHARLTEAAGALTESDYAPLREAAGKGREAFASAFLATVRADPRLSRLAPVLLYRTLGPTLPDGAAAAAVLWAAAHRCAADNADGVRRAGYGEGFEAGEALFEAILTGRSGVVITEDEWATVFSRVRHKDGLIRLAVPELLVDLTELASRPLPERSLEWPFVLTAGERRAFSANTIIRDPSWRRRGADGALRMSPLDVERLGLTLGARARLTTSRGSLEVVVEPTDRMQPGHVSLPNGFGLGGHPAAVAGIAPNELTATEHRDPWFGTPFHKHVPARVEPVTGDGKVSPTADPTIMGVTSSD
ncbi:molybdopterin-dependent oxidoreductase [Streptomyces sp. NPDC017991]|uniref:molybdopterin-dependent oxidoreductase n=1 Tax=Streptomyces sp. NPDC017991 TaxID=3365026 RepID=UPI0037AEE80F